MGTGAAGTGAGTGSSSLLLPSTPRGIVVSAGDLPPGGLPLAQRPPAVRYALGTMGLQVRARGEGGTKGQGPTTFLPRSLAKRYCYRARSGGR
jgi:hypothetical protein